MASHSNGLEDGCVSRIQSMVIPLTALLRVTDTVLKSTAPCEVTAMMLLAIGSAVRNCGVITMDCRESNFLLGNPTGDAYRKKLDIVEVVLWISMSLRTVSRNSKYSL
jgi:hypothetical protein